jgi:uncharacterized protein (TIGR03083 family)
MPEEHRDAYRDLRLRVREIVLAAGPDAGAVPSPATPEWTVHDVLAHVVGVCDDVENGRLEGVASDEWTAKQVDARRASSTIEILDEWDTRGPVFEDLLVGAPALMAGQVLFDAFTHESDIRRALDAPGARECAAADLGWDFVVSARMRPGATPLRFVTDRDDLVTGEGEPVATITTSRFEILRASTGRRSADEIAAYGWEPSPQPELLLLAPFFRLRAEPLAE